MPHLQAGSPTSEAWSVCFPIQFLFLHFHQVKTFLFTMLLRAWFLNSVLVWKLLFLSVACFYGLCFYVGLGF